MATQTVEARAATGQTVTGKLFAAGSDTEVASVSGTEASNRKGTYRFAFTDIPAGEYLLIIQNATPIPIASWWVTLTLSTDTFQVYSKADTRDIASGTVDIQSSVSDIESKLDIVDTNVDTLLDRITATLFSGITYLSRWLGAIAGKTADTGTRAEINATTAGAGYNETTDSLEALRDRGDVAWITGGGGGTGARTVLITVTLESVALEGALVRLSKGAESYVRTTDVDGECTFNIDDGTWTVAITAANADFEGDELIVNGDETPDPYDMTPIAFLPSDPDKVTGYYTCFNQAGVVESGVTITVICDKPPSTGGLGLDSAIRTGTSGASGVIQFTNMFPGATYKIKRNAGQNYVVKIPDDATGEVALNSIIGP